MMEFITRYQIPLILGGLLIIMALIGYEAEQRDAIKRGEKVKKKKKKNKKGEEEVVAVEGVVEPGAIESATYVDENTVTYTVPEAVVAQPEYPVTEETVVASDVVTPEGEIPVGYEAQVYQAVADNNQAMASNESLQAFMEPTTNVASTDTFGVNDMSAFQVSQVQNPEAQNNNVEEWKL